VTEQTGPTTDPLRTDRITELDVALRDGGVLHVYDTGPSDEGALPVLWHHGTPNTGHPPAPLFDTATELGLRWVGYDRPGYGGSTPAPDRPVSPAATHAEAVADALGLDRFAVMCHSGGGPHALACAAMLSSRVVAAVAVARLAPYGPEGLEPAAYTAGMAAPGGSALHAAAHVAPTPRRTVDQRRNRTPKVVLEGTRLTHKTDLAFALQEHPRVTGARRYRYHFPLVSAEWGTLTDEPWGQSLISYAPANSAVARAGYDAWVALFRAHRYYPWFVDRFHLSTQVHQAAAGTPVDLDDVDEALADLGFCLVHCVRRPETFPAAREARLLVSGNPSQYDDLNVFIAEQEAMVRAVARSSMPSLTLDVSDGDVATLADRVAGWLEKERLLGPSG